MNEQNESEKQKIIEAMAFIHKKHTKRRCLWCGIDRFKPWPVLIHAPVVTSLYDEKISEKNKALSFYPVICEICGFTMYFHEKTVDGTMKDISKPTANSEGQENDALQTIEKKDT